VSDHVPPPFREPAALPRIALIAQSYTRLLGMPIIADEADVVAALWHAPCAIVAHGTEPDPLFFFGNAVALATLGYAPQLFIGLPSRLSAEAPLREERQALLERVSSAGFVDDYAGVRIDAEGRRFRIEAATVWNLVDARGVVQGQAAKFAR
jgi:hypothetical protein